MCLPPMAEDHGAAARCAKPEDTRASTHRDPPRLRFTYGSVEFGRHEFAGTVAPKLVGQRPDTFSVRLGRPSVGRICELAWPTGQIQYRQRGT